MKIVLYILGRKGHAVLEALVEDFGSESIACVICTRDRSIDDDWYEQNFALCKMNCISFIDREIHDGLIEEDPDVAIAVGWRWMIKSEENLVVLHDSLLPGYRGFSPLVNMLIDGRREIGVTAILASDKYDRGPIVAQESIDIEYPKKVSEAIEDIIPIYSSLAVRICRSISNSQEICAVPQNENEATYSVWRDESDYFINWSSSADEVRRFVDALGQPFPGARTTLNEENVRVLEVENTSDVEVENRKAHIGKVLFFEAGFPVVVCGSGLVIVKKIISSNGIDDIKSIPLRSRFGSRWLT